MTISKQSTRLLQLTKDLPRYPQRVFHFTSYFDAVFWFS